MPLKYVLAELNFARTLYPLSDARMAEFVANLETINKLAEVSDGFVWRLKDDSGSSASFRFGDDPLILVNLSVWRSAEALFDYVYRSGHLEFWKRKHEWFEEKSGRTVLWWIPEGTTPTLEEAAAKLDALHSNGSTAQAFTFRSRFPPPT